MNGAGNWAAISSLVAKNGSGSHTAVGGNITIAHGLGVTPKLVRISAYARKSSGVDLESNGAYNGTTNSCAYRYYNSGGSTDGIGNSTTRIIYLDEGINTAAFTATMDSTNITLTANSDGKDFNYEWEAIG